MDRSGPNTVQQTAGTSSGTGGLPLSFPPVQGQQVAPASLLESSWAGVLDFTQQQTTAQPLSASGASTGMGSDWHVLKLNNEGSSSSSPRSLPDSLTEDCSRSNLSASAGCLEGSDGSSGSGLKNEAIADLLLQSTTDVLPTLRLNEIVEAEQEAPAEAPEAAPASSRDGEAAELGAMLDIDSFEAVRAQGTVSSEGSVDGYDSEASFPTSPRMRLMEASELELEVEVEEELSGVVGVLAQIADALKGGYEQVHLWASDKMGPLLKVVRHSYRAVAAYVGAHHPALRTTVLQLYASLQKSTYSNWRVLALSVSVVALGVALMRASHTNSVMARQLQQKDSELARLVVKIFTLQDNLQNPRHTPMIRHTHMTTAAMHPLF